MQQSESGQLLELLTDACKLAIAFVGMPYGDKMRIKISHGYAGAEEIDLQNSFCAHVMREGSYVEINDAHKDMRSSSCEMLRSHPAVRLYAGVPVCTSQGEVIAVLCVMGFARRRLSLRSRKLILRVAMLVGNLIYKEQMQNQLRKRALQESALTTQFFRESAALQIVYDSNGRIIDASEALLHFIDLTREQILGMNMLKLFAQESRRRYVCSVESVLAEMENCRNILLRVVTGSGSRENVFFSVNAIPDQGESSRYACATLTLTPHLLHPDFLTLYSSDHAATTLHAIGDGVICIDAYHAVEYLNPSAELLTGWSAAEAKGMPVTSLFDIVDGHSKLAIENPLLQCMGRNEVVRLPPNAMMLNRYAEEIYIDDSASPIRDTAGNVIGAVMVFHDVSEQLRLQQEINYQSSHDHLTGLLNRSEFEKHLQTALLSANEQRMVHAVCVINLDQFKIVNDTCGHAAGDEYLRQLAGFIQEKLRKNDVLARLGGDEFGVLFVNCPVSYALNVAENLKNSIENFRFLWNRLVLRISVSVGVVALKYPMGKMENILNAANQACYAAKESGRNSVHLYVAQDTEILRRSGEMSHIAHVPLAMETNRLQLYAQRISPLRRDHCGESNIEILLRMQDESGEVIAPARFMPGLERYHQAVAIDRWVVSNTLTWLRQHREFTEAFGHCAINLSGQSLSDLVFQEFVLSELEHFGPVRQKICFEVTETAAIANLNRARHFMFALRQRGCLLALDDFGAGLSSLGYLRNLPVDILKIDGMFVRSIADDQIDQELVRSINAIAQLLGKSTVAEGVENTHTWDVLQTIGVDYAQGYVLGRPQPLDALALQW